MCQHCWLPTGTPLKKATRYRKRALSTLVLVLCRRDIVIGAFPPHERTPTQETTSNVITSSFSNDGHADPPTISPLSPVASPPLNDPLRASLDPVLHKFWVSKAEAIWIWRTLREKLHWQDLALLTAVGWLSVPALQVSYDRMWHGGTDAESKERRVHFADTILCLLASHVQQVAQIACLVYAVDVLRVVAIGLGWVSRHHHVRALSDAFAQSAYVAWLANRSASLKKYLLRRYVNTYPDTYGRIQIVNRLLDAAIYGLGTVIVLNILEVEMGLAMHSILAVGSVSTLAMGLASQGIVSQILHGLLLASSDRLYEGDHVQFGNGKSGVIQKLGWMETVLRGTDEVSVIIPNSDLVKQHVSNLSRVRYSQIKQTLKFSYTDVAALPNVLQAIKDEIVDYCPHVINDGTRPLRVYWINYAPSNTLEVMVEVHLRVRPISEEYWRSRQLVLQAIDRAVKNCNITMIGG